MNLIKINNGVSIDSTKISHLTNIKIDSSIDNISKVTLEFYAKVDGLDNIQPDYEFKSIKNGYKPHRKYKSR